MAKWGMVIDLDKCTGCQACTTACAMENNRLPTENWQDVLFYHEGTYPNVKLMWFPRPCMHCEHPSCVSVCPTKATYKVAEGGFVQDGAIHEFYPPEHRNPATDPFFLYCPVRGSVR